MGAEDWYRNADWSPEIEATFLTKLNRARDKSQYLRIQAGILADTHPAVALELLAQYFALDEDWDHAQAFCDEAVAKLALGNLVGALECYQRALRREQAYPNLKTIAYLALPALIARRRLVERYTYALDLLQQHRDRPMFPVEVFQWNAARAIILDETGQRREAAEAAKAALAAAAAPQSGLSRHPTIGLVGTREEDLLEAVQEIARQ